MRSVLGGAVQSAAPLCEGCVANRLRRSHLVLLPHYRGKGLSSTAALVILARRLARIAWSIYTYKTDFDPGRLTKGLT